MYKSSDNKIIIILSVYLCDEKWFHIQIVSHVQRLQWQERKKIHTHTTSGPILSTSIKINKLHSHRYIYGRSVGRSLILASRAHGQITKKKEINPFYTFTAQSYSISMCGWWKPAKITRHDCVRLLIRMCADKDGEARMGHEKWQMYNKLCRKWKSNELFCLFLFFFFLLRSSRTFCIIARLHWTSVHRRHTQQYIRNQRKMYERTACKKKIKCTFAHVQSIYLSVCVCARCEWSLKPFVRNSYSQSANGSSIDHEFMNCIIGRISMESTLCTSTRLAYEAHTHTHTSGGQANINKTFWMFSYVSD